MEDTRDTAFVIFAVAVGMAVGAGFPLVPLVGIPIVAVAAFLFRPREADLPADSADFTLTVRVGAGHDPIGLLPRRLASTWKGLFCRRLATARQGAAIDLTYRVRLRRADTALTLVAELNALEGVLSIDLRRS